VTYFGLEVNKGRDYGVRERRRYPQSGRRGGVDEMSKDVCVCVFDVDRKTDRERERQTDRLTNRLHPYLSPQEQKHFYVEVLENKVTAEFSLKHIC